MASRLTAPASHGSRLQAGAPTTAAKGMITSASLTSRRSRASSRTSPGTKSKAGFAHRWKSGPWP